MGGPKPLSSPGPIRHRPRMTPSLTDTLCTRCGLCCDGSLFADVELVGQREVTRLEILGLDIEDDGGKNALLLQPCAVLRRRRCGIYAHRPTCCRTFECRLLQDVRRGEVSVARAAERIADVVERIRHVEGLLAQLGRRATRLPLKERCAEALAGEPGRTQQHKRARAKLEAAMITVEELIRKRFLGGEGRAAGGADRRGPSSSRPSP